jgi:hypothetical protein
MSETDADKSMDAAVSRIEGHLRHDNGQAAFNEFYKEVCALEQRGGGKAAVAANEDKFFQKILAKDAELKALGYPTLELTENGQRVLATVHHKDGRTDDGFVDSTSYGNLHPSKGMHRLEPHLTAEEGTLDPAGEKSASSDDPTNFFKPGDILKSKVSDSNFSLGADVQKSLSDSTKQYYLGGHLDVIVDGRSVPIDCKGIPFNCPEGYRVRAAIPPGAGGSLSETGGVVRMHADGQRYYDIDQLNLNGKIQTASSGRVFWSMPLNKQTRDGAATY